MVILPTKKDGGSLVRLPGQSRENNYFWPGASVDVSLRGACGSVKIDIPFFFNSASFFCWPVTSVTRTDGDSLFFMSSRGRLRRDRNRRFEYSNSDSGLGCLPMR